MARIGIYIGSSSDSPENIEEVLAAWGEYLNQHDVETFGGARLPQNLSELVNHVDIGGRDSVTPFDKIYTSYTQCKKYIRERSPDILIQIWKYPTHAPGVAAAGYQYEIPTVVRFTGDTFNEYKGYDAPTKFGVFLLDNIFGRFPLQIADCVITFGPHSKEEVIKRGISPSKVFVLPPPAPNTEQFEYSQEGKNHRSEYGLNPDRPLALYVGRLSEQKGMEFLRKVIKMAINHSNYQFLLIGEGPFRAKFQEEFHNDDCKLPGYIPHSEIGSYYKSADVYVHPSPFEGIPLVILEALSCNLPVVARSAGDIPLITPNIVNQPFEMVDRLVKREYSADWLNKHLFSNQYQKEKLDEIVVTLQNLQ